MNHVQIGSSHFLAPDEWNKLTGAHLRQIVTVLHSHSNDRHHLRLRLLCVLLGVRLPLVLALTVVQQLQLLELTNFLLAGNGLTTQLLPRIKLPWRHDYRQQYYYGPRDGLRNLTFLEFIFADSYFMHYAADHDVALLDKLVAVLYRPQRRDYAPKSPSYRGDRREDFNEHLVADRAERLAHLPYDLKLAIHTWYAGCRTALEEEYPMVFTASNQEEAAGEGTWAHVLRAMSGRAFGTLDQTSQQNAHTVLAQMQDDGEAAERLRAQSSQTPS